MILQKQRTRSEPMSETAGGEDSSRKDHSRDRMHSRMIQKRHKGQDTGCILNKNDNYPKKEVTFCASEREGSGEGHDIHSTSKNGYVTNRAHYCVPDETKRRTHRIMPTNQ